MWENSIELLGHAIRELQVAVERSSTKVEIVLEEHFYGDYDKMKKICDNLEIKTITELLRGEFTNYDIKSEVRIGYLKSIISFSKGPCMKSYPLVWKLTLRKKKV